MTEAQQEYHSFGPWIYEISQKHPVPPLFRAYDHPDRPCLMKVKVPANMDRKDATPGMHLYDFLITMESDQVRILKREGDSVFESQIFYNEIMGAEDYRELLKGRLTLFLQSHSIEIPYNTSSREVVDRMVRLIRERYAGSKAYFQIEDVTTVPEPEDMLYRNLLRDLRQAETGFQLVAVQNQRRLVSADNGLSAWVRDMFSAPVMYDSVHLISRGELMIFSRGLVCGRLRKAHYGVAVTCLSLAMLSGTELTQDARYSDMLRMNLRLQVHRPEFGFEVSNTAALAFYRHGIADILRSEQ